MIADAEASGMDEASLANLQAELARPIEINDEAAEFEGVWPENVATVEAFFAAGSQWRVVSRSAGGMATPAGSIIAPIVPCYVGLDYAAVRVALDAEAIEVTPNLWRGLRVMESEACAVLNEAWQ